MSQFTLSFPKRFMPNEVDKSVLDKFAVQFKQSFKNFDPTLFLLSDKYSCLQFQFANTMHAPNWSKPVGRSREIIVIKVLVGHMATVFKVHELKERVSIALMKTLDEILANPDLMIGQGKTLENIHDVANIQYLKNFLSNNVNV